MVNDVGDLLNQGLLNRGRIDFNFLLRLGGRLKLEAHKATKGVLNGVFNVQRHFHLKLVHDLKLLGFHGNGSFFFRLELSLFLFLSLLLYFLCEL